jgi:hypothetical protein
MLKTLRTTVILLCTQGDMDKLERDRVVREFREGKTKILISTDVLARGFDVSQVRLSMRPGHRALSIFKLVMSNLGASLYYIVWLFSKSSWSHEARHFSGAPAGSVYVGWAHGLWQRMIISSKGHLRYGFVFCFQSRQIFQPVSGERSELPCSRHVYVP